MSNSLKEVAMSPDKDARRARNVSRTAGLALILGLATGVVAQAIPSSAATVAAPLAAQSQVGAGRAIAFHQATTKATRILANLRESFTIPAGTGRYATTIHGIRITVTKSATANYCDIDSQTLLSEATVQGVASISCADEVYAAAVGAALYYGTTEESYNVNAEYSTFFVQVMTTAPLQAGTWQTEALADVYWTGPSAYTQYSKNSSAYWDY
jgi:hypothetical protein